MSEDRVPDCMMSNTVTQMITSSRVDYEKTMRQISSGNNFLARSDDPGTTSQIQSIDNISANNEQWGKNIDKAISWEKATDTAIDSITSALQRVNELIAEADSGLTVAGDRNAVATEINTIIESLVQYGNTSHLGVSLFSGTATNVDKNGNVVDNPFTVDRDAEGNITNVYYLGNNDANVVPDTETRTIGIAENSTVKMGLLGEGNKSLFQFTHYENIGTEAVPDWQNVNVRLFDELIKFRDNLTSTTDAPDETNCARIQFALDNVLERSVVCYSNQSKLSGASSNMTGISAVTSNRSDELSGVDVSLATIKLSEVQVALQSSISMLDMVQKMAIINFV